MFPLLSLIIFLPLVGAVGTLGLPRMAGWFWALLFAVGDLAAALSLVPFFNVNASGFQFTEHAPWLGDAGISYALGVDGLSLFLIALNALLTAVAVGASWRVARTNPRSREYFALMMLLSCGMQGVFLATNLFLFYVFWEVMLIPAYLLVGMFGGPRRAYAAIKFVLYTAVGSLLMLVGILVTGALTAGPRGLHAGPAGAAGRGCPARRADLALPRLRRRLRREIHALPLPQLGARYLQPGACDGHCADRGSDGQDGDVRLPALLPAALPRRHQHAIGP